MAIYKTNPAYKMEGKFEHQGQQKNPYYTIASKNVLRQPFSKYEDSTNE